MKWNLHQGRNVDYLTIPEWEEFSVTAAFSTRKGGVSAFPYSSLNLALHVQDDPAQVLENRRLFLAELNCRLENCTAVRQVHGKRVVEVSAAVKGRGMLEAGEDVPEADGMVSTDDTGLLGFYADCVPVYFVSPQAGLVGLAHAGWRGTAQNVVRAMMEKIRALGGSAEDCRAAIGPCIGPCCYEVGPELAAEFAAFGDSRILTRKASGKYMIDLPGANKALLLQEGILAENIVDAPFCTSCRSDLFFSYRREGLTGRMGAFIQRKV